MTSAGARVKLDKLNNAKVFIHETRLGFVNVPRIINYYIIFNNHTENVNIIKS